MRRFVSLILIVFAAAAFCMAQVPASNHVFFLVEDNQSYSDVIGNSSLPYVNSLAQKYGLATSYYANTHPSIGNYFMMTTGRIYTNDDSYLGPLPSSVDNIVRRMITGGKTWKSYAEGVPSVGYLGGDTLSKGDYYKRHNPFSYFSDVAGSSTEVLNLVGTKQLVSDLANNQSPDLSFIVPNGMDDAHDGTPQTMDTWLSQYVPRILASKAFQPGGDGMLFITFDESLTSDTTYGGGHIVTIVISPKGKAGYKSGATVYQHQSLLKTMLLALGLPTDLGAAASAPDMGEFFGASTTTAAATPTPAPTPALASAAIPAPSTGSGVAVSSPVSGSTSTSPVPVVASATAPSGRTITTMRVYVDSVSAYTVSANQISTSLDMAAGAHTIVVNAWDNTGAVYVSSATSVTVASSSTVAPTPTPTPTPEPTPGGSTPPTTGSSTSSPETFLAYVTGYGWPDNTPPGNATSAPTGNGAAGGTGTYANPITMAAGFTPYPCPDPCNAGNIALVWPAGTIFYVPNVRRYFVIADECAECYAYPSGTQTWVDLWVGGDNSSNSNDVETCESTITGNFDIIKNPPSTYEVVTGPLYSDTSGCTEQYGNTPVPL